MNQNKDIRKGLKPGIGLYEQMRNIEPTTDNRLSLEVFDKWFASITEELKKHSPTKVWKLKRNLRDL